MDQATLLAARDLLAATLTNPVDVHGVPSFLVPDGYMRILHEDLLPAPRRIQITEKFGTAASFIAYVERFASPSTSVFSNLENQTFMAVIDYHDPGTPSWSDHRAIYQCPVSSEWKTWIKNNGEWMSQKSFAAFIERNAKDIRAPSSAEMLEIVTTLEAKNNVRIKQSTRLDNGQVQFEYVEEIDGKAGNMGQLRIPTDITLALRIHNGAAAYAVPAKFRYRINDDKSLSLCYEILNPEALLEDAFTSAEEQIIAGLSGKAHFYRRG